MASALIRPRGDTAANWTFINPVLELREIAIETDTYRLKVGDGTTSWTGLPYVSPGSPGDLTHVATRTALAALAIPLPGVSMYLVESGREGIFVWDNSNLSTQVAADPRQGLYVAPSSDTTGASGAWVRKYSGSLDIRWFGGVGDAFAIGTGTDNTPALNAAAALGAVLGYGSLILFPIALGHYRFATQPNEFTNGVSVIGQGYHENPGSVNGVTFSFPNNYTGSVLRFDADVKGFTFSAYTSNAANVPVAQYQSANHCHMRDLALVSLGGVGTTGHGADLYVTGHFQNVRISGFAGNGVNLNGNTAGSSRYGSTDLFSFYSCIFDANKLHGVYLDGNDDNIVNFYGCSFRNNGGAGSLDVTTVGNNVFTACHWATNNKSNPTNSSSGFSAAQISKVQADAPCLTDNLTGSAIQYRGKIYDNSDIGNGSAYLCCYVESGSGSLARLRAPTHVIGGFMAIASVRHSQWTAQTFNGNEIDNVINFTNIDQGANFTFKDGNLVLTRSSGTDSNLPTITLTPTAGAASVINMQGVSGAAGLSLQANSGNGFIQADTIFWRNNAGSTVFGTASSSGILSKVPLGYATGAGGVITQATSRTTGVTLNTSCGQITLVSAAGTATWQTFTVTNSKVVATDVIRLSQASGADKYMMHVTGVRAGSFDITFATTGGTTTEQPVINFAVIKAVAA